MYTGRRYFILVLLFIASMINYIDRAALSILAPYITTDLNVNKAELGLIFSSFAIGYAVFCFVGGWLADKYGPRRIFAGAMGLWSLFAGLTCAAFNFTSLFIIRVIFGAAEGPMGSVTNKTIVKWFPARERARAVGVSFSGNPMGGAVSAPIVAASALAFGWRMTFVGMMLIGFVWVVVWLIATKGSEAPKEEADARTVAETVGNDLPDEKLSYYLKQPIILFTALAFFAYSYILFFFMTWFPSYLLDARGLNMRDMSIANVLPWLLGFVGLISGGFISDYIYKLTNNLLFSRKVIIVVGLIIAAICITASALVLNLYGAIALMSVGMFAMYVTTSCYWAIVQDTVKGNNVGAVSGFIHFLANLAGVFAPMLTGFIVQGTGQYYSAFYLVGALAIGSAVLLMLGGKKQTIA
ncbi:MFS transporter [Enterobacter hormaechei]|uniref:4-hydroxyphenylpyruvate dioxygenase n=3 Tax=Enterobacter cloacae complex TaxID=354276 RepID=A0A822X1T6_9ENTR|nr:MULTISPECIES: MFS transporter [Enterobacter cloacae complex]AIE61855.1 hexuronate transporter [Enterobacter cloacae ECNIH2]AKK77396.1 hexuronate transporter [Enterobacter hormaechei]AKK90438.1 hexuronate transporter [Enterobacter hormaechei]AKK98414.1 hexuronate transporter [Enterobacter hormaechei]AKL53785.1 hexuronate transporter [Enterobacter hormaechei]